MRVDYAFYVGVDWGSQTQQVCVLDPRGAIVREDVVPHREAGLRQLLTWLRELCHGDLSRVAIGIEMPRGALVEALVEAGAHVYHLNPKQLDRFRDRHSVAGAKDDRRDAFVLGDSLRTDRVCFRRVRIDDPSIIELREASRLESQLLQQHRRLANRLYGQLHRVFPQLLELSPGADEPWLWDLLTQTAWPEVVRQWTKAQAIKLLRAHRIRRFDAERLLDVLRQPALPVAGGTIAAVTKHVGMLVEQLQLVQRQRRECIAWIERLLAQLSLPEDDEGQPRQHRDAEILLSMPGAGKLVAATVLGEASQAVADRDYQLLRTLSGVAPVTRSSGKSRRVTMRRSCNPRLRYALYHWLFNSLQHDAPTRARYDELRGRGQTHPHALRTLADRHLRILVAMLRDGTLWSPPGAAPPLAASSLTAPLADKEAA